MNKVKNIILILLFFMAIMFITNKVEATSISASPSRPKKGQSVTITVSVPNVNTVDLTATISGAGTSGTIRLVDGSMTGEAKTFSKSITVTPKSTGTIKVTVSSSSNAVLNGEYVNVAASKSITVREESSSGGNSSGSGSSNNTTTTQPKKSSDTTLRELTVEEGTISPEFDNDVKEYTLIVPNETTKINVKATPTDNKATVKVEGNEDLKEGENPVTITVTAEDGTTDKYTINVTRERAKLSLQSLIIKYENENGEQIEIPLNPAFSNEIQEYTLDNIEYWVEKLNIEAIANIEGATIEVQGADNLQTGENIIKITVKLPAQEQEETTEENEEELSAEEETIIYTIKVNKNEEPTILAKISNWFKGIFGGVSSWYNNNQEQAIVGALGICIIALFGLSIYIIVDYNKYKDVIAKVKKVKKVKKVNEININKNITEEIYQKNNAETLEKQEKKADNENNVKSGKHF